MRSAARAAPEAGSAGREGPRSVARGGSGRRRTCNPPVKSRELCLLSYGAGRCGRQESNLRRPAFQTGALPAELRPRVVGGSPSIHPPRGGRSMQRRGTPPSVCRAVETSALFSKPLAHPSTLDRRPPAARAQVVTVLRGGALEPDPRAVRKIAAQIEQISATQLIRERVEPFSLERGLDPSSCFSSWASPSSLVRHRSPPKQRRRPIRVAHERSRSAPCHLAHAALLEGSHGPRPV